MEYVDYANNRKDHISENTNFKEQSLKRLNNLNRRYKLMYSRSTKSNSPEHTLDQSYIENNWLTCFQTHQEHAAVSSCQVQMATRQCDCLVSIEHQV